MKRTLIVLLACAWLGISAYVLDQARRPLKHANDPSAPLTSVAARAPSADVRPDETPQERMARLQLPAEEPRVKRILPRAMADVSHPPQWTRPRALPAPPAPPDPWTPPEAATNAERGHHSNVE